MGRIAAQHGMSKATSARQSSNSRKRLNLTRPRGNSQADKVRVLVDERKKNKSKISDLEEQVKTLNDRLYLAAKKTAVTAVVSKRQK